VWSFAYENYPVKLADPIRLGLSGAKLLDAVTKSTLPNDRQVPGI
jgi:hypothetical protein